MEITLLAKIVMVFWLLALLAGAALAKEAVVYASERSSLSELLSRQLQDAGFTVSEAGNDTLTELLEKKPDLLALPEARLFPASAIDELEGFLQGGGNLLTIGGSSLDELLVKSGDQWLTFSQAREKAKNQPPDHLIFDFKRGDQAYWQRSTDKPALLDRLHVYDGAMSSFVEQVGIWNTYLSPELEKPFPDGHRLTIFEAKGGPNTTRLFVEWREGDGSRWISEVQLTERWKTYVLAPEDFKYFHESKSEGRGGSGDHFRPENAQFFSVGLAGNFGPLAPGSHLWWLRKVGSAPDDAADTMVSRPKLETISPAYKTYPMRGVKRLRLRSDQAVMTSGFDLTGSFEGRMPIWRPRGLGYNPANLPPVRFIPVVDSFGQHGEWLGTAAWMFVNFDGKYKDSIWASIGLEADELPSVALTPIVNLAARMAQRMFSAPFLRAAGSSHFAMNPGQQTSLGAAVVNPDCPPAEVSLQFEFVQDARSRPLTSLSGSMVETSGKTSWPEDLQVLSSLPGPARVDCQMYVGDDVVDIISQHVTIREPDPACDWIEVQDGQFVLKGRPVFINSVNYWPRSSAALEPGEYGLGWLNWWQYDPEVIERDLRVLEELHVNVVAIQYMKPEMGPQLIDFIERCRTHRIYLNIFIDGGHPLGFKPGRLEQLLDAAELTDNPRVFAFDLAWEPNLGRQDRRAVLNSRWGEWIEEQYGSLEAAQKDWDYQLSLDAEGRPEGPTDDQLISDGNWRRMVAAYRRFADDVISRGYNQVRSFFKEIGSRHLISARTGYGGTGQMWIAPSFPYDLASGAAHLDFISPEGYMLTGDLDNYLAAGFTTEYGRFVSGGKPVLWAEYGQSVWPANYDPASLQLQADHYTKNYELFTKSHSNGGAAWWFPGGLRVDENSDYGIVQQDLIPRPAGYVLRDWAEKAVRSTYLPAASSTVSVDRDLYVSGYAGVWSAHRQEYLKAIKKGKRLAITSKGIGRNSENAPDVAVGNTRWEGLKPSKYLNGELGSLQIMGADGKTWENWNGGPVVVKKSQGLRMRLVATNTGEAEWIAGERRSSVSLNLSHPSGVQTARLPVNVARFAIAEIDLAIDCSPYESGTLVEFTLRLSTDSRPFGQSLRLNASVLE